MPTGHYCGAGYSSAVMKFHSTVPYRYISNFALPGYMWSVRTPTTAAVFFDKKNQRDQRKFYFPQISRRKVIP